MFNIFRRGPTKEELKGIDRALDRLMAGPVQAAAAKPVEAGVPKPASVMQTVKREVRIEAPVSQVNWPDLKQNVDGLERAAQGAPERVNWHTLRDVTILEMQANYAGATLMLKEWDLRLMTYQEALFAIDRYLDLKVALEGKWFYIKGEGARLGSRFWTLHPDDSLKEGKSGNPEKNLYVFKGDQPLSFMVFSDHDTAIRGGRFHIDADDGFSKQRPVVVGLPKRIPIDSICEDVGRQT